MRVIILLLFFVVVAGGGMVAHAEQKDYAGEIQQTMTDWGKQQLTDTIKGIFKTRQDEQAEVNRLTFGIMTIQVGYLLSYGWLVACIMPDKVAGLIKTTAAIGSIQVVMDYIYMWINS